MLCEGQMYLLNKIHLPFTEQAGTIFRATIHCVCWPCDAWRKDSDSTMMSYIEQGFAGEAEPVAEGQLVHYLPLQTVVKLKKESLVGPAKSISMEENIKVRVLKNGSARVKNGLSLNDVLHQSPNLLPDLINVLPRFRESKIAVATDVEKAFLQFRIKPEHRSLQ